MIAWDPSLAVGHEAIDAQHLAIIELINTLAAKRGNVEPGDAVETLRFLRQYLNSHFEMETELMLDSSYPDLDSHQEQHELFINHVIFFELEKEFGVVTGQMLDDILAFLKDWFLRHIATEDKALAVFVRTRTLSA